MKPTQAQATILHAVLSTAVATIIGASTAATQFYFNHGQDLWLALVFFGGSLPATFGTLRYAVWHAIQTSPALAQAEVDTKNEILDFMTNDFGGFINQHFGHIGDRLQALEQAIANHSHAPLPTAPAPSQVPQLSFLAPGTASIPPTVAFSGPATFTNANSANMTASVPSPSLVVTSQPQAPMLGTIPTLQAVQP